MRKFFTFLLLIIWFHVLWAQAPAGYYDPAAGLSGTQLKAALYNIIKGHTEYPYSSSTSTDVWDILKESDRDPNNPNNVILLYTGWSVDAAQEYNNGNGWSREHVWAKSRGNFGTAPGPGTDCHHLRPVDVSVNSARSNRWFAECNEEYYDNGVPTGSYTSSTEWVWKPRDAVKGDVARMIFYMATRYEGENGEPDLEVVDYIPADNSTTLPIHAKLSDLLLWNQQDPVDDFERNRNEVVYSYQHNRNPFIDHPEYVEAIWGTGTSTPTAPAAPNTLTLVANALSLDLNWTDLSNEDGYTLYRSSDNVNFTQLANLTANTTSYSDATVVSGTVYYYYLTAYNSVGTSANGNTVSGQLDTGGNSNYATDLFFSEYAEGSSYNKALEISNFTGVDVDLSHYVIKKQTNGAGSWSTGLSLSGVLTQGNSYVVANSSASQTILNVADIITGAGEMTFNGNDALSLWKDGVMIDIIGTFNDATTFGADVTKIRNADVTSPNTNYSTSEWTDHAKDYFVDLGTHTFSGSGTTPPPSCDVPTGLAVSNITEYSADLSWTAVSSATGYSLQYKESSATSWISVTVGTNSYSLSGLNPSTQYEFQVSTTCSSGTSAFSTSFFFTTNDLPVITYCQPTGYTKFEWINYVELADMVNTSGADGGYADFSAKTAHLTPGQTYPIYFQAEFRRSFYTEYWSVWIDFNKDGDFDDAGELLAEGSTSDNGTYYMDLNIPATAIGTTRLRISMNDNGYHTACYNPRYGEIEDYTVDFGALKARQARGKNADLAQRNEAQVQGIYPNPANDRIYLTHEVEAKVAIYSISGKLIQISHLYSNS